jgi:oligosaccharide repeat unit polymerase
MSEFHKQLNLLAFRKVEILLAGIFLGIGLFTPTLTRLLPEGSAMLTREWHFLTKLFIVLLGVACITPLAYQFAKHGASGVECFSPTIAFPVLYFAVFGLGPLKLLANSDKRSFLVLSYALAGILFFYIGVLAMHLRHRTSQKIKMPSEMVTDWDPYLFKLIIFSLLVISFLATSYHAYKTGLPIFIPNVESKRVWIQQEVTNYVVFLMRLVTPAFFYFLTYGLVSRKVKSITLIAFSFVSFLVLLSLANRHDIFTFFVGSLVIFNFAGRRLKLSSLAPILIMGFMSLMLIGFYRLISLSYVTPEKYLLIQTAGDNLILMFLVYSAFQFTNYPLNFAIYLDSFPSTMPFEWGYSFIRAVSTILPGHQDLLDEYVKSKLNLGFLGGGLNPTLLGELYANFGCWGVLGMSVYGAVITYLYHQASKEEGSIKIIVYAYGMSCLLLSLIGGFFSHFLYFYYMVVIFGVHFLAVRRRFHVCNSSSVE